MAVRYPSVGIDVKLDDGSQADTATITADDYSQWYDLDDCDYFGVALQTGTVASTCNIIVQARFNEEAHIYSLPCNEARGDAFEAFDLTQATYCQLNVTADDDDSGFLAYWKNPLPQVGQSGQIRFFFDAGASCSLPIEQMVLIKVARGG